MKPDSLAKVAVSRVVLHMNRRQRLAEGRAKDVLGYRRVWFFLTRYGEALLLREMQVQNFHLSERDPRPVYG